MKSKKQTGTWKRFLGSRMLLVFEIAVIVLFSVALAKEIIRRWEVRTEITKLEDEIEQLETQNAELSGLISYFQSDYYKEREARLKLGLQKEGESALSLPVIQNSDSETEDGSGTPIAARSGDTTIPQKWWNYFFSKQ